MCDLVFVCEVSMARRSQRLLPRVDFEGGGGGGGLGAVSVAWGVSDGGRGRSVLDIFGEGAVCVDPARAGVFYFMLCSVCGGIWL